jgi:hypothetical protein
LLYATADDLIDAHGIDPGSLDDRLLDGAQHIVRMGS